MKVGATNRSLPRRGLTARSARTNEASGSIDAFTLIELLVAVGITAIVAGMMLAVTMQVLRSWRSTQAAQAQAIAARQILDAIERDLHAARHRSDDRVWLAIDILDDATALANHGWFLGSPRAKPAEGQSLRLLGEPDADGTPDTSRARWGLSGAWLRFVTTHVEADGGLPTTVAYQLARRPVTGDPVATNAAPVRYGLYRSVITAADTFAVGYDVTASAYAAENNFPSHALSSAFRQPRNVMNPSHANLLAGNVVDFGCSLYRETPGGELARIFPASATDLSHYATGSGVSDETKFPHAVDVFVRLLSETGATELASWEQGLTARPPESATDAEWWWSIVERESAVFVRRIVIRGEGR